MYCMVWHAEPEHKNMPYEVQDETVTSTRMGVSFYPPPPPHMTPPQLHTNTGITSYIVEYNATCTVWCGMQTQKREIMPYEVQGSDSDFDWNEWII